MSSNTTGYKLTKADFQQINRRNLLGFQAGWNYERMQHSGYLWIILPQLRKIYGDNTEALKTAARTQCAPFFNTSNFLNTIITGIDLALEETDGLDSLETVASLKTGLMGPLASIGDSIFGSLLPTIFGALAANMAMQGNPLGIFIWIAVNIVVDWFRCKQTYIAYDQGMKLAAAHAIAGLITPEELGPETIIPSLFDERVAPAVAKAVAEAARASGSARL